MAKNAHQKLKLIYLLKILEEKTDMFHTLTMPQIVTHLKKHGILAERKSLYDDIEALKVFGVDIRCVKTKTYNYFIGDRKFSLPEVKLLVDAVQSSKFITYKKSFELIKKLESFGSMYEARQLQGQVHVANRIKTMNESIYHNIDKIHSAIAQNRQIRFQYNEWVIPSVRSSSKQETDNIRPSRQFRKNGQVYSVSPWSLCWDNENYYTVAYYAKHKGLSNFRVDKMEHIEIVDIERDGKDDFKQFDMAVYSKKIFSMFGGQDEVVELQFSNHLIGVVIDRFGKDIQIRRADGNHFIVTIRAAISPTFFAWVFTFGNEAKILSPLPVIKLFKKQVRKALKQY